MGNIDFNKGMGKIKKRVKKSGVKSKEKDNFKCRTTNGKICPFMSTPEADRACTSRCKLYRPKQKDYECYFMALQRISWLLKKINGEEEEEEQ